MQKIALDKFQIQELVSINKYKIGENNKFLSRCIDGRYPNTFPNPLSIPGGDGGDLALLMATANTYGFEVNLNKAYELLLQIIGGVDNFNIHTDDHHLEEGVGAGCGHLAQIKSDPKAYNLEDEQVKDLFVLLEKAKKDGAKETVLQGAHLEGAVLMIKGSYGVGSQYYFQTGPEKVPSQVFVFNQTLADERHKIWAKKLHEDKVVELYKDVDGEYLYQVLSEMMENHLLETSKRLAKGLNIYSVEFKEQGEFIIGEMDMIK